MKNTKRIISLMLITALFFSITASAFAASYVAMGDSISNGCGLDTFERADGVDDRGYNRKVEGSYPVVFAEKMDLELYPRAFSAARAEELLYMLDPNFAGDDMLHGQFTEYFEMHGGIDFIRKDLEEKISEADYLSLTIGANNIGMYFIYQYKAWAAGKPYAFDREGYSKNSQLFKSQEYKEIEETFKQALVLAGKAKELIPLFVESLRYTYSGLIECFEALTARIYEMNPDITIIMNGIINPFKELHLYRNMLNLGDVAGLMINHINNYLQNKNPYADNENYIYVDISQTEIPPFPKNLISQEFFTALEGDMRYCTHPSFAGQEYIANRMIEKLKVPYYDVNAEDKFFDAAAYVTENNLMEGKKTHEFAPYGIATRAMAAAALYNLAGAPEVNGDINFNDVKADESYKDAIAWAVENDIMQGVTKKIFAPYGGMTRQKLITMLWKAAGEEASDFDISSYKDARMVSKTAKTAMAWAAENKLFEGLNESNKLLPLNIATRADLAVILTNYCK